MGSWTYDNVGKGTSWAVEVEADDLWDAREVLEDVAAAVRANDVFEVEYDKPVLT
jgi:hypothetical protein